jgi:hypothetical protein
MARRRVDRRVPATPSPSLHARRDAPGRAAFNDDGRAARPLLAFVGRSAAGVTRGALLLKHGPSADC